MHTFLETLGRQNITKPFFGETRRIQSPEKTLERIKKIFPILGITRVANVTGLDHLDIPVYVACRPNSRSLSVSQGKGYSHPAAQVSAIMESVESYHAETIHLDLKLGSQNEIGYEFNCVDTVRLARHKNIDLDKRMLWVEGIDLFTRLGKWIPFESVHLDYRFPLPNCNGSFISSSNGLASGNSYHEALIHGICEVIERDALTLWSLNTPEEQSSRKISIDTIKDIRAIEILEKFSIAGIDVGIWDITSNLDVPSFLCRIIPQMEPDISGLRPASGMGCHLSKDVALLRALTEAAQSRLTFISGARDDLSREDYQKYLQIEEYQRWQESIRSLGPRNYSDIPNVETQTFDGDLQALLNALQKNGIEEVMAIDLTKKSFNIPVTKVIIPGLESFLSPKSQILGERAGRILSVKGQTHG